MRRILASRTKRRSGLSLIEILIALFIFMIGVLGVLSMFPVAMSSASRAMGEMRGQVLAQSAIAQLSADCAAPCEISSSGDVIADVAASPAPTVNRFAFEGQATDWTGCFVTFPNTGGADTRSYRDKCRRITLQSSAGSPNVNTITVTPDWDPDPADPTKRPQAGDRFVITRMGLPDPRNDETKSRDGYVREFVSSDSFHAGKPIYSDPASGAGHPWYSFNEPGVEPLTWATDWFTAAFPTKYVPDNGGADTIGKSGAGWTNDQFRGKLLVVTADSSNSDNMAGQVRLITTNDPSTITVFPIFAVSHTANPTDWPNVFFEVRDRLGYYLLITNGRSAGRIFPITGYVRDAVAGDQITCAGIDLRDFGVTEAKSATGKLSPDDYEYKLKNPTGFTILGSRSVLGTAYYDGEKSLLCDGVEHRLLYRLNSFGAPGTAESQTGDDLFWGYNTTTSVWELSEGSPYSSICIFSDNGFYTSPPYPQLSNPVRVDVFTFRNFGQSKPIEENLKPVGFLTGYVGRPAQ